MSRRAVELKNRHKVFFVIEIMVNLKPESGSLLSAALNIFAKSSDLRRGFISHGRLPLKIAARAPSGGDTPAGAVSRVGFWVSAPPGWSVDPLAVDGWAFEVRQARPQILVFVRLPPEFPQLPRYHLNVLDLSRRNRHVEGIHLVRDPRVQSGTQTHKVEIVRGNCKASSLVAIPERVSLCDPPK